MPLRSSLLTDKRRLGAAAGGLAALLAVGGCSGKAAPVAEPAPPVVAPAEEGDADEPVVDAAEEPVTDAAEEPNGPVADQPPPAAPEAPVQPEARPDYPSEGVVVVEPGGDPGGDRSRSLLEAARAERARRTQSPQPSIVITDKNLADYASGDLTVASAPPADGGEEAEATTPGGEAAEAAGGDDPGEARGEDYWRSRALEIRLDWRAASERIEELEGRVGELRMRFYAEDDGFYRDSQIKPAWDRAIDQLRQARLDVDRHRQELEALLEEGRRAGALPGWLREGIDYEPEPPAEPSAIHEPGEPPVAEEPKGGA